MNFQTARAKLGLKDAQQYQVKTEINCVICQVKQVEYSKTSGKPGQSLCLRDETGVEEWVKMQGQFEPLDNTFIGKTYQFLVWPFKPDSSPKTYLYCWIQRQVAPQTAPQTPQMPPQSTNTNTPADMLTNIYGVLCRIQELIEKETSFEKKYNIPPDEDSNPPGKPQQEDETVPW